MENNNNNNNGVNADQQRPNRRNRRANRQRRADDAGNIPAVVAPAQAAAAPVAVEVLPPAPARPQGEGQRRQRGRRNPNQPPRQQGRGAGPIPAPRAAGRGAAAPQVQRAIAEEVRGAALEAGIPVEYEQAPPEPSLVSSYFGTRTVTVDPNNYSLRAFCESNGMKVWLAPAPIGQHPIAHAAREVMTRAAVSTVLSKVTTEEIILLDDLYGSAARTSRSLKLSARQGGEVVVRSLAPAKHPEDFRAGERLSCAAQGQADMSLLIDVYHTTEEEKEWISQRVLASKTQTLAYICHHFNGGDAYGADTYVGKYDLAGVDKEGKPNSSTVSKPYSTEEGAWVMMDNGQMLFTSSPTEPSVPPHGLGLWSELTTPGVTLMGEIEWESTCVKILGPFALWIVRPKRQAHMQPYAWCPRPMRKIQPVSGWQPARRTGLTGLVVNTPNRAICSLASQVGVAGVLDTIWPCRFIDMESLSRLTAGLRLVVSEGHSAHTQFAQVESAVRAGAAAAVARRFGSIIYEGHCPDYLISTIAGTYDAHLGVEARSGTIGIIEGVRCTQEGADVEGRTRNVVSRTPTLFKRYHVWKIAGVAVVGFLLYQSKKRYGAGPIGSIGENFSSDVVEVLSVARTFLGACCENLKDLAAGAKQGFAVARESLIEQGVVSPIMELNPLKHAWSGLCAAGIIPALQTAAFFAPFALCEEMLKQYMPSLALPIFAFETVRNYAMFGPAAFVTLGMHAVTYCIGKVSIPASTFIHTVYNLSVTASATESLKLFKLGGALGMNAAGAALGAYHAWKTSRLEHRPYVEEPFSCALPPTDSTVARTSSLSVHVPESIDPDVLLEVRMPGVHMVGERGCRAGWLITGEACRVLTVDAQVTDVRPVQLMLSTTALPHVPSNDPLTHFNAVAQRLAVDPWKGDRLDKLKVQRALTRSHELLKLLVFEDGSTMENAFVLHADYENLTMDIDRFFAAMGAKGKRYRNLHSTLYDGGWFNAKERLQMNLKSNESISLKEVDDMFDMVGRIIWNLPTEDLYKTIPLISRISAMTHEIFNTYTTAKMYSAYHGKIVPVHIDWSAGLTPAKSAEYWKFFEDHRHEDAVWIRISGDDTQIIYMLAGVEDILNGDFSKFDQTQRSPHMVWLLGSFYKMAMWGYSCSDHEQLATWLANINAPIFRKATVNIAHSPIRILLGLAVQMATGRADTSLGSFVNALHFCLSSVFECSHPDEVPNVARDQGFHYKVSRDDFRQSTFLKKWRVRNVADYTWSEISLPSAVIKLGKSLAQPSSFRLKGEPRFEVGSSRWHEVIADMARAQALSYGGIPENYPILGPFLVKMASFSVKTAEQLKDYMPRQYEDGYRVEVPQGLLLDREHMLSRVAARYTITFEQIEEVEQQIAAVTSLPFFLHHPVYARMASIDY